MSMTLRLTEEQDRMLTDLAAREGLSKQEAVIRAIADRASRLSRDSEIRSVTRKAILRYGPLLDRLAE
ncbi:hypothetical protein [Segniliparus rugosus]|uniref:CopG family transcriptional regulator n=1 Tax=Segniliparus rugosus (strain ATCC BAA-974 / DSM 45345 / CCUG 50838 / CIP 108380 / JCM 13579 / CDC 945) TaxID=679197 RepID=E5XLB2_SEGRC|nr:hypothetical protein [Segniliparus rugosus]EFV14862.1 hypothetical protein HMPREF9336_00281 [Segniliparus rugosus ATCC BAA-974]